MEDESVREAAPEDLDQWLDQQAYPFVYRLSRLHRTLSGFAAAGLTTCGLGLAAWWLGQYRQSPINAWAIWVAPVSAAFAVAFGLWWWQSTRRWAVTLWRDAIELATVLGRQRLDRDQIQGVRDTHTSLGSAELRIVARSGQGRDLRLPTSMELDAALASWLSQLVNLDEQRMQALQRRVQADPVWGEPAEERWPRLLQYQQVSGTLQPVFIATVAVVWTWFWQETGSVWLLASIPLLGLMAIGLFRGRLRADAGSDDPRPSLFLIITLATALLAVEIVPAATLSSWTGVTMAALGLGAALSWWASRASGPSLSEQWAWRWVLPVVLWSYALAGLVVINTQLDSDPGHEVGQAVITHKRWRLNEVLHQFQLTLDPVSPAGPVRTEQVSQQVFNRLSPGARACLMRRPGRLGWPWTDIQACPGQRAQATGPWAEAQYRALVVGAYLPERRGPLLKMLVEQRFDELDARLQEMQAEFDQGATDSFHLLSAYRDFYDPNPELDVLFNRWIQHFPTSYPARLALGIHRKYQVVRLRNSYLEVGLRQHSQEIAAAQMQVTELEQSLGLTRKPILSFVHLLDEAGLQGDRARMRQLLSKGLAVDPGSLPLTRKYLWVLGDDLQAMSQFVDRCSADGVPRRTLDTLEAVLRVHEAWRAERQGDTATALDKLRAASELDALDEDRVIALLEWSRLLVRGRRFEESLLALEKAKEFGADDVKVYASLAHTLWQLGRRQESLDATRRAATLGDASSQAYLGEVLLRGELMPKDMSEASVWLRRADAAGNASARRVLREHPELPR